jgi:hypothetical protein
MAVNRVVLQHMSINMMDEDAIEEFIKESESAWEANKENIEHVSIDASGPATAPSSVTTSVVASTPTVGLESNNNKLAEKRKAPHALPPFGLSPPSESKLIQRRSRQQSSQSLNFSCRTKSTLTKNSCDYLVADLVSPCNYVESPGC